MPRPVTVPSYRLFLILFVLFVGSIFFSVTGTLLMGFFPAQAGQALSWLGVHLGLSLEALVKGPTWVYMALMPLLTLLLYLPALGARRSVLFLLWGSAVGAAAELLGTQTGVPFGAYGYSDLLGAKIAGHVPWFIPPSWYAMSLLSYDLARRLDLRRGGTILMTAVFMVLWDVALDPAMTTPVAVGRSFWTYAADGVYFGMPLVNWLGWLLTSAGIAWGYERMRGGREVRAAWAPALYAVNVLFPVFICFAYGAALAGAFGLVALAVVLALTRRAGSPVLPPRRAEVAGL